MLTEFDTSEVWEDVPDYEGIYQCSSYGRIKTITNEGRYRKKFIKLQRDSDGYVIVNLSKNSKAITLKVHRIIGSVFVDNPNNFPIINHEDGVKQNNYRYNLKWCTYSYNAFHAHRMGLKHGSDRQLKAFSLTHINHRKKVYQHSLVGELINVYDSFKEADKLNGFSRGYVSFCINGKIKKPRKGYIWSLIKLDQTFNSWIK